MGGTTRAVRTARGGRKAMALADSLERRLETGEIRVGGFTPSERELSRNWNVGKMTVRRALKLLEKKGLIAAEPGQGYRVQGRALDPALGFPVAFVVSPAERHLYSTMRASQILLSVFQQRAAERGVALLVVGMGEGGYGEVADQCESGRTSGVVLDSHDKRLIDIVTQSGLPTVAVESWQAGAEVDSVVQDGFGGGLLAAAHMISRGHKRIGYLGLDVGKGNPIVVDRYSGVVGGLASKRMQLTHEETAKNREDDMQEAAIKLLSGPKRPTAILALWQTATAGLARAARELGLTIGEDFEMVGWANEENYESGFKNLFDPGKVPAAIVWKASSMAEIALERLEVRRVRPELPTIQLRIPTMLKQETKIGVGD